MDFIGFPKIARWSRPCAVTEKIDGTNAQVWIPEPESVAGLLVEGVITHEYPFLCGSRSRWITPKDDNYKFAAWAYENWQELQKLGPGHHFGEWWGQGIQRNYGLREKRFSLFNVSRWRDSEKRPTCCHVVPILFEGEFDGLNPQTFIDTLKNEGSFAVLGYMNPEGIIIHHYHGRFSFKKTLDNDEKGKGE